MKFPLIYVDPPWTYKVWSKKGEGRSACSHYDVMNIEDIKSLPVNELASKNSVLLVWVTFPILPEALNVLTAWGFDYKTVAFTWVKRNKKNYTWFWGMGYYTRANPEICILATKGKGLPVLNRSVHSVIDTPIEEHSKKPDVVRKLIVQLFGNIQPRIELFARKKAPEWICVGNEIDGRDIREVMQETIKDRIEFNKVA